MRLRRYAAAAGRRFAAEGGYSLSELLVVLAVIGIVVGALVALFVSASNAQVDMNRRFEAQQEMRLALDKLRREIHCAKEVSGTPPTSSIVITLGPYCPTSPTYGSTSEAQVIWCVKDKNGAVPPNPNPDAGAPYSLWRYLGNDCTSTDPAKKPRKEADYLKIHEVFAAYPTPPVGSLPTLSVELPVDVTPADAKQLYKLEDDIVLRNAIRKALAPPGA
jgi:prepilin-type N-terminal cleavage/methylation domain-containing protein